MRAREFVIVVIIAKITFANLISIAAVEKKGELIIIGQIKSKKFVAIAFIIVTMITTILIYDWEYQADPSFMMILCLICKDQRRQICLVLIFWEATAAVAAIWVVSENF